ncbi:uncharacterized protein [Typha angustifolia]|uniref:uncharacterized protein n=1 Tax=Typha angustifolia TaxID=59011 RepID=UPI003C2F9642
MGSPIGFAFLLMLVISCTKVGARDLVASDIVFMPVSNSRPSESKISIGIERSELLCELCEEFTAEALVYLSENETQSEIINALHKGCSRLHTLKQQCITLVDYYAPVLFMEVSTVSPEQFCGKVNLCGPMTMVPLPTRDDSCTLCHHVVAEIINKLKDPDTQLEIIEILLKGCSRLENFTQKCKKLVFQYGPLILANIEKFLDATDICTSIHACKASTEVVIEAVGLFTA